MSDKLLIITVGLSATNAAPNPVLQKKPGEIPPFVIDIMLEYAYHSKWCRKKQFSRGLVGNVFTPFSQPAAALERARTRQLGPIDWLAR
jgi:hypothetical protein